METVKKTAEYEIIKKRSGRYGVRGANRKWITGDDKVKILLAEKLIKAPPPKEKAPEPVPEPAPEPATEEASAEAAPAEAPEESAEEETSSEAPAEEEASK